MQRPSLSSSMEHTRGPAHSRTQPRGSGRCCTEQLCPQRPCSSSSTASGSDWKYSEGITEVSNCFVYGMHTSNVIELINNMQGNNAQCRRTMRWRRPERSMAVALSCNVLGEGGRYPLSLPEP